MQDRTRLCRTVLGALEIFSILKCLFLHYLDCELTHELRLIEFLDMEHCIELELFACFIYFHTKQ